MFGILILLSFCSICLGAASLATYAAREEKLSCCSVTTKLYKVTA